MKNSLITGIAFLLGATTFASGQDNVDFGKYGQSAATLSAIASAVAFVGPCSVPLIFEETRSEEGVQLAVHCRGNEEDEASVFIQFIGDDALLLPKNFEFAG
ncbi:MAG: hypothetical protein ABJO09_15965 [Hyphomicrobiales bacterium]